MSEKTVPDEDTTDSKNLSISNEVASTTISDLDYPKVRVEELDHSQEFFEQHTTSFSYAWKIGLVLLLLKMEF